LHRGVVALALSLASALALAEPAGVLGDWRDPTGSVIRIDRCGADVCLWIAALSPAAPTTADIHNPDPGRRNHALCGLEIGSGFALHDSSHASGGWLYDPKSGKTYHGAISAEGEKLNLRGYVLVPLFGESQTWIQVREPVTSCAGSRSGS